MDYCDIERFALEMNRDHSVIFEIASKYCISDSFVDYDGHSISSRDSCHRSRHNGHRSSMLSTEPAVGSLVAAPRGLFKTRQQPPEELLS